MSSTYPLKQFKAKVVRVIDGDTIVVNIELGFGVSKVETVRIAFIDAYETRLGKKTTPAMKVKGLAGKKFLKALIPVDAKVKLTTIKEKGKFGRYVADVQLTDISKISECAGRSMISSIMVYKGFAISAEYYIMKKDIKVFNDKLRKDLEIPKGKIETTCGTADKQFFDSFVIGYVVGIKKGKTISLYNGKALCSMNEEPRVYVTKSYAKKLSLKLAKYWNCPPVIKPISMEVFV